MGADALSEVLKTIRLTGAVYFDCAAKVPPWVAEQMPAAMILPRILPGGENLIAYHVVVEGRCFANLIDGDSFPLEAGDIIVFTRGDPHVIASAPGMRAELVAPGALDVVSANQLPLLLNYGEDGPTSARFVCGYLACDAHPFNPLIEALPRVIVTKAGDGDGWLGAFASLARTESVERRAGGESVLARLSELMFIEVVRRHFETQSDHQAGWLAGLRDPFVGKALSLMHGAPTRDWTIQELARLVGQSRSVLAERFTALVGIPPMHYLAKWRIQIASGLLRDRNANVAAVAAEAGYASEAAFSRAFKKIVGVPPSTWRDRLAA